MTDSTLPTLLSFKQFSEKLKTGCFMSWQNQKKNIFTQFSCFVHTNEPFLDWVRYAQQVGFYATSGFYIRRNDQLSCWLRKKLKALSMPICISQLVCSEFRETFIWKRRSATDARNGSSIRHSSWQRLYCTSLFHTWQGWLLSLISATTWGLTVSTTTSRYADTPFSKRHNGRSVWKCFLRLLNSQSVIFMLQGCHW